jgi:hypothetical protein
MRKVVTPSEVAHFWAHQTQSEATNQNRSFYFDGKSIYSYGRHFTIATHSHNNKILFTTRDYSNTTAKHKSIVRSAIAYRDVIYCPYPSNGEFSNANFQYWKSEAEEIAQNLTNSRKPEKYLSQLSYLKNQVEAYILHFNVQMPIDLEVIFSISDKAQYFEYSAKKEAYRIAEEKRIQAKRVKAHKKELEKWRKFETSRLYSRPLDCDYLRKDSENFETSQGVKIPLAVGMRLYERLTANVVAVGETFLNFRIEEINKKFIKIGCHKITFNEINKAIK